MNFKATKKRTVHMPVPLGIVIFSVFLISTVFADITINAGSKIDLNTSTIKMNCGDLVINNGGIVNVDTGVIETVGNQVILPMGILNEGSGTITSCGVVFEGAPVTSDGGDAGTYTISLFTIPEGEVNFTLTADTSCCTISPTTFTLTDTTPQTITVTAPVGISGTHFCDIVHEITGSTSSVYPAPATLETIQATVFGADTGFIFTESGGNTQVSEDISAIDSYTIEPRVAPSGPVVLTVSGHENQFNISPARLTFINSTPQTITIYPISDGKYEGGNQNITLAHTITASSDPANYPITMPVDNIVVTVNDGGIVASHSDGNTIVLRDGGSDTISVKLLEIPAGIVLVTATPVTLTDPQLQTNAVTLTPNQLTFSNDATALDEQTITITSNTSDPLPGGKLEFEISLSAAAYATQYLSADLTEETQSENLRVVITESEGTTTIAEGGVNTDSYNIQLSEIADLAVTISTDGQALVKEESQASFEKTQSLVFSTSNWNIPQTILVQANDDDLTENTIHEGIISHSYSNCEGKTGSTVIVNIQDNDQASFIVSQISGNVSENGGTASFSVKLNSKPTGKVVIDLESMDPSEGTVSPSELIINPDLWDNDHIVTVTGVNDDIIDGTHDFTVRLIPRSSGDEGSYKTTDTSGYASLGPQLVAVSNIDNDAGIITSHFSGSASEAGDQRTFGIKLSSQPSGVVEVFLTSSNILEGVISPTSMTFTSESWDTWQFATITGVDDSIDDGHTDFIIQIETSSAVPEYSALTPTDITVVNYDSVPAIHYNSEPFIFSYVTDQVNYRQENGFTVYIIKKGETNLTKVSVKSPDGSSINIDNITGDGSEENPYTFKWSPAASWTDHILDSPETLDETYHIDFKLFSGNGNEEPVQIANTVWIDFADNVANPKSISDARLKTEAEFSAEVLFESITDIGFEVGTATAAKFLIVGRDNLAEVYNLTLPPISADYLFIDDSNGLSGGNLNYDPETDFYTIDESVSDYAELHADDKLLLRATYDSIESSLSEGTLTLSIIVYEGPNKGAAIKYNPIQIPNSIRRESAPVIRFTIPGDSVLEMIKTIINERGDGTPGFVQHGMAESEPSAGLFEVQTNHLSTFSLKNADSGSDSNCFISTTAN